MVHDPNKLVRDRFCSIIYLYHETHEWEDYQIAHKFLDILSENSQKCLNYFLLICYFLVSNSIVLSKKREQQQNAANPSIYSVPFDNFRIFKVYIIEYIHTVIFSRTHYTNVDGVVKLNLDEQNSYLLKLIKQKIDPNFSFNDDLHEPDPNFSPHKKQQEDSEEKGKGRIEHSDKFVDPSQALEMMKKTANLLPVNLTEIYNKNLSDLKNFLTISHEFFLKVLIQMNDNITLYFKESKHKTVQQIIRHNISATKQWRFIWSLLTMDGGGPWKNSSKEEMHKKRDNTFCSYYVPMKLKRNWNFQTHEAASKAKVLGIVEKGKPLVERIPQHIQSKLEEQFELKMKQNLIKSSCTVINISKEKKGFINLYKDLINITFEKDNYPPLEIRYEDITLFLHQAYLHMKNNAFEIFTFFGTSHFIVLNNEEECKQCIKIIEGKLQQKAKDESARFNLQFDQITAQWAQGNMSNFEYLVYLNMKSNRSFNVASQYPIFPWVLRDFSSDSIDLSDDTVFRDLSKPVGTFGKERLEMLKERFKDLKIFSPPGYMYVCGPMCSLVVYLYMLRIEPFTTLHIELQSGRFDCANRLFSSVPKLFKQICNDANDFNELIPEFFFMFEQFRNSDHFDFGLDKEKCPNGDVVLPPWAQNDPLLFVYVMRRALEDDRVSINLSNWIDLIYGFKQKGKAAEESDNVYNPELLDDYWTPEILSDPHQKQTSEASKLYFGQMPKQLFNEHHIDKITIDSDSREKELISADFRPFLVAHNIQDNVFSFVDKEGKLVVFQLTQNRELKTKNTFQFDPSMFKFGVVSSSSFTDSKIGFMNSKSQVFIIDCKKWKLNLFKDNIQCFSSTENYFLVVCNENVVSLYRECDLEKPFRTASFFNESAKCCCISETFHLFIIGSRDGSLVLHSFTREETSVNLITLAKNVVPRFVFVSKAFGFITTVAKVIYDSVSSQQKTKIFVHSINGSKVRELELPHGITHAFVFTSRKGFDYIVIAFNNVIQCAELYYLQFKTVEINVNVKPVYLSYDESKREIICIGSNGNILFIPFDPELTKFK